MCVLGEANSSESEPRKPRLASLRCSTPVRASTCSIGSVMASGSGSPASGRNGDGLLNPHADQAPVLRPRAVVVADPLIAEQLVQDEPGMAAPLADPAVGDDVLV